MPSPYLNTLISLAKNDLPQISHDLNNSSTIYTVQAQAQKILTIVTYLVHHIILSDPTVERATAAAAPARAPAPPALPPPPPGYRYVRAGDGQIYLSPIPQEAVAMPPAVNHYPSQVPAGQVAMPTPVHFDTGVGLPVIGPAAEQQAAALGEQVTEVVITPRGSRVSVPGQPTMNLPPGVPIDAASMLQHQVSTQPVAGRIPVPGLPSVGNPGTPTVEETIVLPMGGSMPAAVAAALANRAGDQPIIDASGGARNVTHE